jgi:NitT/TauT family transport system substrate-binding protein
VRNEYLKANGAQVRAFVAASLQGWRDTIADPRLAGEIVAKHVKGLDPEVVRQEIAIVNELVATAETRTRGLGTIDPAVMQASIDLIARNIGGGRVSATEIYDPGHLPQPPITP